MIDYEARIKEIVSDIRHNGGGMLSDMMKAEYISCDPEQKMATIGFKRFKWEENGRGEIHGGVVSAMMDTSMGITAMAFMDHDISTADLSVSFIRPFRGDRFIITSEVIHQGRRVIRLQARAYDADTNKLLASATSNFMPVNYEQHRGVLGV